MRRTTGRFATLMCLLLLVGCSRDRESLDQWSHAYTTFQDAGAETGTCLRLPVDRESEYWRALADAVNIFVSDRNRESSATLAIDAYNRQTTPILAVCAEAVVKMDASIATLIETANRIRDEAARRKAIEIAQHARRIEATFSSVLTLYRRRFELQVAMLQDMVAMKGSLSTIEASRSRAEELQRLVTDTDQKWQQVVTYWQNIKDSFSAMKGQFNLTSYPSKRDTESVSPVK